MHLLLKLYLLILLFIIDYYFNILIVPISGNSFALPCAALTIPKIEKTKMTKDNKETISPKNAILDKNIFNIPIATSIISRTKPWFA